MNYLMAVKRKEEQLHIRMKDEFKDDLRLVAEANGQTMSGYVYLLIAQSIRKAKADMPEVFLKDERPAVVVGNDGILNADEKTATAKKRRVK